jgi:hypothetical protein
VTDTYKQLLEEYRLPCLPLAEVQARYFPRYRHQSSLLRAIKAGRVTLRVTPLQRGRYSHRVVYLQDLADWLDAQRNTNKHHTAAADQAARHCKGDTAWISPPYKHLPSSVRWPEWP